MYIVKTRLTDQFEQEWYSDINTLRKCCSYRLFKTDFALEPYLLTLSYNNRITLCEFRVSDHKLAIELGRHLNIHKEERYCNLCQQGKIGNEYHFLLECNTLVNIRSKYMSEMYYTNHSNWKFFKKILNSHDEKELLKLSIFIKEGMEQLNRYILCIPFILTIFICFCTSYARHIIMMMYYLSYVFVQFIEIQ